MTSRTDVLLLRLDSIRCDIDFHQVTEITDEKEYLAEYRRLQSIYAKLLDKARMNHLPIPPWKGDHLVYSPLDGWVYFVDH